MKPNWQEKNWSLARNLTAHKLKDSKSKYKRCKMLMMISSKKYKKVIKIKFHRFSKSNNHF